MKKLTMKEINQKQENIRIQTEILAQKKLKLEKQIEKLAEDYQNLEDLKLQKEENSHEDKTKQRSFEVSEEAKAYASRVLGF